MGSPIVRFGYWLGAIILLASAPISGYFLLQVFLTARATAAWPTVPGEITRAEVREVFGRYSADVSYTYTVAGRPYVGHRVRASDGDSELREAAEQAIEGLKPGGRVEVHYDPADPGRSVLQAGVGFQEKALLLVPLLMLALGIRAVVRLRRFGG